MNFAAATNALQRNEMVYREGWRKKSTFIFLQIDATIPLDGIPKMQSLPQSVKNKFLERAKEDNLDAIHYSCQMAIVDEHNHIRGYSPSVEDTLADDWHIFP